MIIMTYWTDEYLQQMQEAEPFGGYRLMENNPSSNNQTPSVDIIAAGRTARNNLNDNGFAFLVASWTSSGEVKAVQYYDDENSKWFSLGARNNARSDFRTLFPNGNQRNSIDDGLPGDGGTTYYYVLFPSGTNIESILQTLERNGWAPERKPMDSAAWKTVNMEIMKKKRQRHGTAVAQSVADKTGAQQELDWVGTGAK